MKKKRFSGWSMLFSILAAVILTLAIAVGIVWHVIGTEGLSMGEAIFLIQTRFVGDHDIGTATDDALGALISGLGDRWSYYADPDAYSQLLESKSNAYVGIGATVDLSTGDEGLTVTSVIKGGPADQAGITAGETIVAVDGVNLTGEDRKNGPTLTRGAEGSTVTLTIRGTDGVERTLTVTRSKVEEDPVTWTLLDDGTGLVTIKNFNSRCASEAEGAVRALQEQNATRIVFDVRNNGGGYLKELTDLLDYLLPEGIVFRGESKSGKANIVESDASCVKLPMAVLVNENTYSAAELFAAELKEFNWATTVGTATTGKGYSQQTFPLPNGGAINLSTARYCTGNGVSLVKTGGIVPDHVVTLTEAQDSAVKARTLDPADDPQIQAAIAALTQS